MALATPLEHNFPIDDPTPVPAHLFSKAMRAARNNGYEMYFDETLPYGVGGATDKYSREIMVAPNLMEAHRFNVMVHELGHAFTPRFAYEFDVMEEIVVQSAAALVTAHYHCTDGRFTVKYLKGHVHGSPWGEERTLEMARPDAVALAQRIIRELDQA
jgi:hypothetical protein